MENMEKRALLAVVLCLGILFFWQSLVFKKRPQPLAPQQTVQVEEKQETVSEPVRGETKRRRTVKATEEEKEIVYETELFRAVFSTFGGALKSWQLKKYKTKVGPGGNWIEMVTQQRPEYYPLSLSLNLPGYEDKRLYVYEVESQKADEIVFVYEDGDIKIEREYRFYPDKYDFKHVTRVWHDDKKIRGDVYLGLSDGTPEVKKKSLLLAPYSDVRNFVYHTQDSAEREKISGIERETEVKQVIRWMGIENRYFVSALINKSSVKPYLVMSKPVPGSGSIDLQFPFHKEQGRDYFELSTIGYIGPKIVDQLKKVDDTFDEAVDFGMFSVICIPLLVTMNFFFKYVKNYGIAILLLTLLIRAIFHPLTKKSLQSMREMQRIQPQIAKVKEKFKDDRQQMNKEVMELMRANKVNPLGGCLPLLFQMPIFFALYRVLYNAIELYQAPFFGWIQDLSAKDPWFITPILMGIAMFLQQKMTPSVSTDPMQKKMMMMMPVIFTFFMIPLPAGLVLYILCSTVLQVMAQYSVNRGLAKKEA